ncbi:hypothetical protein AGDE_14228 [Angomonas deanei]|nr:hypothetical protein AGDE_14228 [Angomonas deanei]|eukprot:EPY21196.1 hypothetical protein AGDE_14228 [Angomonas deanei]
MAFEHHHDGEAIWKWKPKEDPKSDAEDTYAPRLAPSASCWCDRMPRSDGRAPSTTGCTFPLERNNYWKRIKS